MYLAKIKLAAITPNPENPRGIDVLTQDRKLSYLIDSIKELGVQVPLVVVKKKSKFLLLDGERRYHAAKAAGLDEVPAYVHEKALSSKDILYQMFQIHHLREQWSPVQQCRALEKLYEEIAANTKITRIHDVRAQVQAIVDELASATGIDARTAFDRVKFLRFPKSVKDRLYDDPDEDGYWYICEIEEKIIIPALSNYPEYFEKVPVDEVRQHLFDKLQFSVKKSTEVRKVAPVFRRKLERKADQQKVVSLLNRLQRDKEMTYADAEQEFVAEFPDLVKRDPMTPRQFLSAIAALEAATVEFDVSAIAKAKGRSRVAAKEIKAAVESLVASLEDLSGELK